MIEWVGGRVAVPMFVTEGEQHYRPNAVLWAEYPADLIVGMELEEPGQAGVLPVELLRRSLDRPLAEAARRPVRLRVADAELAHELRTEFGTEFEVVLAPTPELDAIVRLMAKDIGQRGPERRYIEGTVTAEPAERLFDAAATFFRLGAWGPLGAVGPFRLDARDLGVDGAALTVIGALGRSRGILLFPSLEDYDAFLAAAEAARPSSGPPDLGTSMISLNFDEAARLPPRMRREAMTQGWPVAGPNAYPVVEHRDPDGLLHPPSALDWDLMALCARLLTAFVERHDGQLGAGMRPYASWHYLPDEPNAWLTLPADAIPGCGYGKDGPGLRMELRLRPAPKRRRKPKEQSGSDGGEVGGKKKRQ